MVDGAPKGVLYQPVVTGTAEAEKIVFTSTIGETVIDKITDVSADVAVAGTAGNYEFSVSLSALGIEPSEIVHRLNSMGDIGILRGNQGQTVQRLYWKNRNVGNVSDIPSEARFQPNYWGLVKFKEVDDVGISHGGNMASAVRLRSGIRAIRGRAISVANPGTTPMALVVCNVMGKQVWESEIGNGTRTVELPRTVAAGTYVATLAGNSSRLSSSRQFVVTR